MTITDRIEGLDTGVSFKAPCRAYATANIANISTIGLGTYDGVSLAENDRVLVANQTTATENGIYIASTSGWLRAGDFDGSRDVVEGTTIFVTEGTTYASSYWYVNVTGQPVPGTDTITFARSTLGAVAGSIAESAITFTDITTGNVSITKHGYAPKAPNDATKYLDGTGAYSIPAGSGATLADGDYGDVVVSGTGTVLSVDTNVITNAKLAQMATLTIKGNNTGGLANALDLTAGQVTAMLAVFAASGAAHAKGLVPDPGATPGTTKFLCEDGTWKNGAGVVSVKTQKFTAGGIYTPTAGMLYCILECVGGGGAGGSVAVSAAHNGAAGGGGSGGYSRAIKSAAQIGASQTVTVGAGGTAGATGNHAGGNGADTSVGSLCIGKGGTGGGGSDGTHNVLGGAGGVAGTGDFTPVGAPGGTGTGGGSITTIDCSGGRGADGPWGGGAKSPIANNGGNSTAGNAGTANTGGGGSGACISDTGGGNVAGGAGGSGVVFITEFCST